MNYRRLGAAVLVLGSLVLVIGMSMYAAGSGSHIRTKPGDTALTAMSRHSRLMEMRQNGTRVMVFGAIAAVAGGLMLFAAKSTKETGADGGTRAENQPPPLPHQRTNPESARWLVPSVTLATMLFWGLGLTFSHMGLGIESLSTLCFLLMALVLLGGAGLLVWLRTVQARSWIPWLVVYVLIAPFLAPVSALILYSKTKVPRQ